jgi:transcriptional regulator with GAF, ATPase, and Fis domain
MIAIAAQHDFPVLILGETGTGKEIVAHAIHECSNRKDHPFISINCSAIPTELFESEIFGFLKDSHSHASRDKKGLWEVADGGTLFLDEIGDLALNHQVKILRSLDSGEILPVGGIKPVKVDARIIAATNKNIDMMAIDNSPGFREDLYYRISTFIIRTPSLSSHPEDIPELAQKTWIELSKNKLSPAVLNRLRYMNWPGNVRLLKHFLRRLYAFFGGENITEEHIEVLHQQDLEGLLKFNRDPKDTLPLNDKDFEKVVMKMEYLLKAALYCEDERQRKDMLARVRESLENILQQ